jgi:hypothetical protein
MPAKGLIPRCSGDEINCSQATKKQNGPKARERAPGPYAKFKLINDDLPMMVASGS